jgi:transposase-like protein
MVRGTVEEALNAIMDAEADRVCGAGRYERSETPKDTRTGHYERALETGAGQVNVSLLVAIGVDAEGFREILCICEGRQGGPV